MSDWREIHARDYLGKDRAERLEDLVVRARRGGLDADEMVEYTALSAEYAEKVQKEMEFRSARRAVAKWVEEAGLGKGGEWSPKMILDAILDEAAVLAPLLRDYATAYDVFTSAPLEADRGDHS